MAAVGWSIAARQDRPQDTPAADAPAADPAAAAQANPNDPAAWRALGSALYDQGRFTEAADAYSRAARLAPDVAIVWSAMGEALVLASKRDPLPAEARAAFAKAIALDPKDPRARYFLAVQKDLDGDHKGAIDDWLALLADTPRRCPVARRCGAHDRTGGQDQQDRHRRPAGHGACHRSRSVARHSARHAACRARHSRTFAGRPCRRLRHAPQRPARHGRRHGDAA
ncbi:tetratricopeptide repeat protein [Novosphingobium colocasiae]